MESAVLDEKGIEATKQLAQGLSSALFGMLLQQVDAVALEYYKRGHAAGKLEGIEEALTPRPIEDAPRDGSFFLGVRLGNSGIETCEPAYFDEEDGKFYFPYRNSYFETEIILGWLPRLNLPTPTP